MYTLYIATSKNEELDEKDVLVGPVALYGLETVGH